MTTIATVTAIVVGAADVAGVAGVGAGRAVARGARGEAEAPQAPRQALNAPETFVVKPFVNVKGARALSYMEAGLPALLAERLGRHAPLRFVGGPWLLRSTGAEARWVVEGAFERGEDRRLQLKVRVRGTAFGGATGEGSRSGEKDAAPILALDAALEAFSAALEKSLSRDAVVVAPFGRDPYAFVMYGRGVGALQARAPERAAEHLRRSLVIDPRVPETRRLLAQLHLDAGRPGHARALLAYALEVRPAYLSALATLAALDRAAGLPTARERFARLVELDPDDTEARRTHGELLSEAGELDLAREELEAVVKAVPGDLRARRALALVLAARRAGAELVSELEHVVELDPENLEARMDLGAAYAGVGRLAEAEAVYDEVLRRKPRHAAALKLGGDLARLRGDVKKAGHLYGKLRWVAPQDPRPLFLLGAAQYEAGNLGAAERMFAEGARYPGMQGDAYSNLGAIALRRGKAGEAIWLLSRAAKRRPGKSGVRYNYALALHATSRHADALNELRAAATLDPKDAGIPFFAGIVALRLGLLREAEEAFREALRLDPRNEAARHNLALLEPLVRAPGEK